MIIVICKGLPVSAEDLCEQFVQPESLVSFFADQSNLESCETTKDDLQACRWSYALGEPQSRDFFESLRSNLSNCPSLTEITHDAGVNHPDFYDAWVFDLPASQVFIALKDKSALSATYVTLRVRPLPRQ